MDRRGNPLPRAAGARHAALSQRFPEEGAIYAWARETQGPLPGFLCGWFCWACNLPFFSGLLVFAVTLLGRVAGGGIGAWMVTPGGTMISSSVLLIAIALMHSAGIGVGKWMPLIGASITIGLFALIILGILPRQPGRIGDRFRPRAISAQARCERCDPLVDHDLRLTAARKESP